MPGKKKGNRNNAKFKNKRDVKFADETQKEAYAQALMRIGSGGGTPQIKILCSDGKERIGNIRGNMVKRRGKWVNPGDILLIQFGGKDDDKFCDVIHKYFPDERPILSSKGLLGFIRKMETNEEDNDIEIDYNGSKIKAEEYDPNQGMRDLPPIESDYSDDSDDDDDEPKKKIIGKDHFGNDIYEEVEVEVKVNKEHPVENNSFSGSESDNDLDNDSQWDNNKKKHYKQEKFVDKKRNKKKGKLRA